MVPLHPELILQAYCQGYFPMAQNRDDVEVLWIDPDERAIIPLDTFQPNRTHTKTLRKHTLKLTINKAFPDVIRACSEPRKEEQDTWINDEIINVFTQLHRLGHAHSIECWDKNNNLIGGIYGTAINSAFFAESMFSRQSNASKIALLTLIYLLKVNQFSLLDVQFYNPHLEQFKIQIITRNQYLDKLESALQKPGQFPSSTPSEGLSVSGATVADGLLQSFTHTS